MEIELTLTDSSPSMPYQPKNTPGKKLFEDHIKDGQRKLFIMELLFLKKYGHLSDTIVYAGAAPGLHIPDLIDRFPTHKWILYDPENIPFRHKNITVKKEFFTTETARLYKGKKYLFISDIRSLDPKKGLKTNIKVANEAVVRDMEQQKEWVKVGRFIMSSLKFRMPWTDGTTTNLKGKLYYQPWTGEFSPELRLFTNGRDVKTYNHKKIDDQMYYHNYVRRRNGYDSKYESYILNLESKV